MLRHFTFLLLITLLAGCAGSPDEEDPTAGMSAAEIYAEAKEKLVNQDYEAAINLYERLESRFPYGAYAEQAQLEVAYAYYKYNEPESAILAAERFIKLHPNHPRVDYAYYLRGLASYDAEQSFFNRIFKQDPTERDPQAARRAFRYFSELVKKFPDSKYSHDAVERLYQLRDGLAQYELHVANFYVQRRAFVAAANRAKYVIEHYPGTPAVAGALDTLVLAYTELGLQDLAADARRVRETNYPKGQGRGTRDE